MLSHGIFILLAISVVKVSGQQHTYTAAVYEHVAMQWRGGDISRPEALNIMAESLNIFETQTKAAAKQDAQIIVFPEYGLFWTNLTRASIFPFLEYIPDPNTVQDWSPCDSPKFFTNDTEVLQRLSCIAKDSQIYLVANMGNKVPCNVERDTNCRDGHYQYNTNVVFDDKGVFVARYHKANLYYEDAYDEAKPEASIFETPFGTFGNVICFDTLFEKPLIPLVVDHNIGNIILTTAWKDSLPLLAAVQYHSAVAVGLGVNILGANLHYPKNRHHGSGIYTPTGPAVYYYNETAGAGKLLVSTIESVNPRIVQRSTFKDKDIKPLPETPFNVTMRRDVYNFLPLSAQSGTVSVCHNRLCCSLKYVKEVQDTDFYAFGSFDGLHEYSVYNNEQKTNYIQVCALLKCANLTEASCGRWTKEAHTRFQHIEITGNFSTPYVFPEMLMVDETRLLKLPTTPINYQNGTLKIVEEMPNPMVAAAMYGRVFEQDRKNRVSGSSGTSPVISLLLMSFVLTCMDRVTT